MSIVHLVAWCVRRCLLALMTQKQMFLLKVVLHDVLFILIIQLEMPKSWCTIPTNKILFLRISGLPDCDVVKLEDSAGLRSGR